MARATFMPSSEPYYELFRMDSGHFDETLTAAILFDRDGKVLGFPIISRGLPDAEKLDVNAIFTAAAAQNATALVLVHHDPARRVQPTPELEALHACLKEASRRFGIILADHIATGYGFWACLREP